FCTAGEVTVDDPGSMLEHIDENNDRLCDYGCGHEFENPADTCGHFCHSDNWFVNFFWNIINLFFRILNIQQYCDCGLLHYDSPLFG
ncbi:MAG: hypothetical protein U0L11_11620, partial [Acutalibacteraceae bacterium]|nr:hypothetical protein [Acutalibacteraceae bacterium]